MKLNPKAFGLTGGILWPLGLLIVSLVAMGGTYWTAIVDLLGPFYLGYDLTPVGILIGMVWGFFDAFIGCYVFAWLYNKLV